MRTLSRLLLLLLCAVLATSTVSRAAAEPTPTPPTAPDPTDTSDNLTFGIGPALPVPATQTVDGRPYLKYLASPGSTVTDEVALINLSDEPVTLKVYATDAVQTGDGAFGLLPGDETPSDAGSWFELNLPRSGEVTVPARSRKKYGRVEVPIVARIPATAEPGDHVAGIVASLVTVGKNDEGARIKFDQRIGLRTYFRVSGPVNPGLTIENLRATYESDNDIKGRGTVALSYDIHNTGNVRMYTSQLVNVTAWRRDPIVLYPAPVADILPGATIHVTETVDQVMIGKVDVEVTLVPKPVDPEIPRTGLVQEQRTLWAWPWLLIAIIAAAVLLLLLLLVAVLWWRHRRKRRRTALPGRRKGKTTKEKGRRAKGEPVLVSRSARVIVAVGVGAIAGMTGAAPASADDVNAPGHLIIEPGQPTGDPANALTEGFWGHEGPNRDQGTFVMADLSGPNGKITDASQSAWIAQFGTTDFNSIGIAFVPASKNGSSERPAVEDGQNAGEVFDWFTTSSLGGGWTGSNDDARSDVVVPVSTLEEYEAWVEDGKPDQVPNEDLQMVNALEPDAPVADFPMGRSIQNRWPAGEEISMVLFRSDGFDANGIPIVYRGSDGHAITTSLTFLTVAGPDDPDVKTSAGYRLLSTSDLPDEGGTGSAEGNNNGKPSGKGGDRAQSDKPGGKSGGKGDHPRSDGTAPTAAGGADPIEASWTNLWTGSGWAMPIAGLAAVLAVALVGGTQLLRNK